MGQATQIGIILAAAAALAAGIRIRRRRAERCPAPGAPGPGVPPPGHVTGSGVWTQAAEQLAALAYDLGIEIALINAAAWKARVDPDATRGLVGAALTLGAPLSAVLPAGPLLRDDQQMIAAASDLESDVAGLLKNARDLACEINDNLTAAERDLERAMTDLRTARQENTKEAAALAAVAAQAVKEAQAQIADCETGLDVAVNLAECLQDALGRLQTVPGDLEDTYAVAYAHIRGGGTLPHDGDFLTGVPA